MEANNSWWLSSKTFSCSNCRQRKKTLVVSCSPSRTLRSLIDCWISRSFQEWFKRKSTRAISFQINKLVIGCALAPSIQVSVSGTNYKGRRSTWKWMITNRWKKSKKKWIRISTMACSKSLITTIWRANWKWNSLTSSSSNSYRQVLRSKTKNQKKWQWSSPMTSIWWSPVYRFSIIEHSCRGPRASWIRPRSIKFRTHKQRRISMTRWKNSSKIPKNRWRKC